MLNKQCYVCKEQFNVLRGQAMYAYYIQKRLPVPEGMTKDDVTCMPCYNKIKDESKEEVKEAQTQVKTLTAELFKRTPEYKKYWDKNGII